MFLSLMRITYRHRYQLHYIYFLNHNIYVYKCDLDSLFFYFQASLFCKFIPPFNNGNLLHQEILCLARVLENRVNHLINDIEQLYDFSLTIQRRRILLRSALIGENDNIGSLNQSASYINSMKITNFLKRTSERLL